MDYKKLNELLPKELVTRIGTYDNSSTKNMNRVIKEFDDYIDKVMDYDSQEEMLAHLDDLQVVQRKFYHFSADSMEYPVLVKSKKLDCYIHNMIIGVELLFD